jgi:hypothetical protein
MHHSLIKIVIVITLFCLITTSYANCDPSDEPQMNITRAEQGIYRYFRFNRYCEYGTIESCSYDSTLILTNNDKVNEYEMSWMPGVWFAEVASSKISDTNTMIYYQVKYYDKKSRQTCYTSKREFYFHEPMQNT